MLDLTNLAANTEAKLITWLKRQDDLYENEGDSEVGDAIYDQVRRYTQAAHPSNVYFTGVGADVRGGKVRLPHTMTGLVQVYEGEAILWVRSHKAEKTTGIASNKYDGTSAQITYDPKGMLQIGFSRGNGFEGADITRHLRNIANLPKQIPATGNTVTVRAEIIMKKADWPAFKKAVKKSDGSEYKNARNAVAGVMNSETAKEGAYPYLQCVAYTIMDTKATKLEQLQTLRQMGFEVATYEEMLGMNMTDANLTARLAAVKAASPYELDGLVLSIGADSVKYKVADASNLKVTTVKDVIYRASKDGYLKPRVQFEPVELVGVTVNFATAFNAKFIQDNKIGPGAQIRITRSGDVIPFIVGVVKPAKEAALPDIEEWDEWEWSANGVDAVLIDSTGRRDVQTKKLVDTFTKLRIDMLKAGNIEKLFDAGFITVEQIIKMTPRQLTQVLGENGSKVAESFKERLENAYWPEFVGSLNLMGRGIGRKKLTSLYQAFQGKIERMKSVEAICAIEGFEEKTAIKIADSMDAVEEFLTAVQGHVSFATFAKPTTATGNKMKGQAVVFTGVRSEELEKKIVEQGGEIKSGISSSVTILVCKDPNSGSSKAKKARDLGIKIVDIREMEKMLFA
jgi:NAD-dependent DNA ligase